MLEDHGLKTNERVHLVANPLTDAILEWIAARIDDLSDELAKEENAKRRARDENENQALSNRLNRWKNKFLRAREVMVSVGKGEGPGEGGTGGGGAGGKGDVPQEGRRLGETAAVAVARHGRQRHAGRRRRRGRQEEERAALPGDPNLRL